ncbi:MAG: ZIP family metal transporter [Nitrospinota bacterium]|nr:ZIP family metal transporter [Nitrospinota bacterium]
MIGESLNGMSPVAMALAGGLFTWSMTAMGAGMVFLKKDLSRKTLDVMLGFAGGVMIAASFWSLLAPSIELSKSLGIAPWLPAAVGFMSGGVFLRVVDKLLPHLHLEHAMDTVEGIKTSWRRTTLLVMAITLHNIPEGLAIGVAFGGVAVGMPEATMGGAMALAMGIGIQNFPEGAAVALPLRREGISAGKSFWFGQLSGAVEPLAAMAGAFFVVIAQPALPYALAFAAGAMIFVVAEEVIPESQINGHGDQATLGLMIGFTVMMILDVVFG